MLLSKKGEDLTKTVVISGGSSGIGMEFIKQYSNINKNVLICNLSRSKPELLKEFYNIRHFPADFTDSESFAEVRSDLIEFLETTHVHGEIMVVNNSGFGSFGLFDETDGQRSSQMIDVNVKAPVLLTADLFPLLKKYGGTVVNIASTAAYQATPFFINYGATKAFLAHWSLGLWRENKGTNIKVITICPGPISTAFFENAGMSETPDGGRGMTVETAVAKMIKAIRRNQPLLICGLMNRITASVAGILPKTWITRIAYSVIRHVKT